MSAVHSIEYLYTCSINHCGKKFKRQSNFSVHLRKYHRRRINDTELDHAREKKVQEKLDLMSYSEESQIELSPFKETLSLNPLDKPLPVEIQLPVLQRKIKNPESNPISSDTKNQSSEVRKIILKSEIFEKAS
jgi:hypothetical protein